MTEIRPFTWADLPALRELWGTTGREGLPEDELRSSLDLNPGLLLLADHADRFDHAEAGIVGAVLGTFDGRRGWIHRLAVHPAHRRRGLAGELVDELERRLAARGAPRINLLVMPDNAAGLRFWQRRGYLACPDVLCTKPVEAADTVSVRRS